MGASKDDATITDVIDELAHPSTHALELVYSVRCNDYAARLQGAQAPDGDIALPNSPIRYGSSALPSLTSAPSEHTDKVLGDLHGVNEIALKELMLDGVIGR